MSERQVFYVFVVLAAVFVAEALYLLFAETRSSRDRVNRRMRLSDPDGDRQAVLVRLRKERGISASGEVDASMAALARLVAQAGLTIGLTRLVALSAGTGIALAMTTALLRQSVLEAVAAMAVGGLLMPLLVLRFLRGRRRKLFGNQLPEAIELIVRSLKAGHPVPVAIGLVGRELADPIGTEFGIVADEVTYGSDLVSALRKMQGRVGQEDLPLFLTAVSIQATSGGNLREILQSLSDVIRQRIKMRRKIKAISAEGRISAYVLTAMPILLMVAIQFISPDYYGEVWGETLTQIGLAGAVGWLVMGNLMMKKMISFRF
ncbi:MAG TPA: type II secretion system F family protein [Methylomirabilota bacterium]|nr:type II secretion system F family protein [Methylomirabilota bacterium]